MSKDSDQSRSPVQLLKRESTTDQALRALRAAIVEGRIPQGAQLREVQLAAGLGTGRGVVREAMRQLVQEGLAHHVVHRGVFVREITPADIVDVLHAREAIEIAAIDLILKADAADLTDVHAALSTMAEAADAGRPWSEIAEIDMALHQALVAASQSARLVRMYATLAAESRMVVHRDSSLPAQQNVADHRAIVDALDARDPVVRDLLRAHLVPPQALLEALSQASDSAAA